MEKNIHHQETAGDQLVTAASPANHPELQNPEFPRPQCSLSALAILHHSWWEHLKGVIPGTVGKKHRQ
jgi:hypothetical protein